MSQITIAEVLVIVPNWTLLIVRAVCAVEGLGNPTRPIKIAMEATNRALEVLVSISLMLTDGPRRDS